MDRMLKDDHSLGSCFFNFTQFAILKILSALVLALSGVKGLNWDPHINCSFPHEQGNMFELTSDGTQACHSQHQQNCQV